MNFREVTGTVKVPANTGIEGFLHTIKEILKKPRVQSINIDGRGSVSFRFFVSEGDDIENTKNFGVDFAALEPYAIIRNADIQEVFLPPDVAASTAVSVMFEKATGDRLRPLAFATGAKSILWDWYRFTTGHELHQTEYFFGLPVLTDRQIPDTVLLLCAGFGKDAAFIDTQASYKIEMPLYEELSQQVPT